MKKTLILFALILCVSLFAFTGCSLLPGGDSESESNDEELKKADASVKFEDITLGVGDKAQLITKITVAGKDVALNYTFDGNNISISSGVLTAIIPETETVVKVNAEGMAEQSFKVTVTAEAVVNNDIKVSLNDLTLKKDESVTLVTGLTIGDKNLTLEYSYEGENIKIENGTLTALVEDTETLVTATAEDFEGKFTVKVEKIVTDGEDVPEVKMSLNDITVTVGDVVNLATNVNIGDEEKILVYMFSGTGISIRNGVLTALEANTETTVTASAEGFEGTFKVTVVEAPEIVVPENTDTEVALNDITVVLTDKITLAATVSIGGEAKELTYSYDGENIAIDNFKLEGLVADTETVVTATAEGFKGTFKVKVVEAQEIFIPDAEVFLNDLTLTVGETATLPGVVNIGGENKVLVYTYEGDSVSVSDGILTALVENTETVITATADGFVGTFTVKIVEEEEVVIPEPEINLGFENLNIEIGDKVALLESVTVNSVVKNITYTFSGNNISIVNGVLTALKHGPTTTVTATAEGYQPTTFSVVVSGDVGTMTIEAPSSIYSNYAGKEIKVTFSKSAFASDVTYTTNNANVKVVDGKIYATGLFSSAVDVTVTAKSKYHTKTFTVNVSNFNKNSAETKVAYYEENIVSNPKNRGGTIFVGDSYFDGYKMTSPPFWTDFYSDFSNEDNIFLMGISSAQIDTLEIVSERIVYPMVPSEIVIHIGFNDVHHSSITPEELSSRIIALCEQYREKIPGVKIYFMGIEPKKNAFTSDQYKNSSLVKAPQASALIKAFADENEWFTFIDTAALCYTDSTRTEINQNFFVSKDLSHPTLPAYDSMRYLLNAARGVANKEDVDTGSGDSGTGSDSEEVVKITIANSSSTSTTNITDTGKTFTTSDGNNLTTYYSISGSMDIYNRPSGANAHIQFRFGTASGYSRFVLWDSDKNGFMGYCGTYNGSHKNETADISVPNVIDITGKTTITWQVVVTGTNAYWYINGEHALTFENIDLDMFNIGCLSIDIDIYNVKLVEKATDSQAYAAILTELGITE